MLVLGTVSFNNLIENCWVLIYYWIETTVDFSEKYRSQVLINIGTDNEVCPTNACNYAHSYFCKQLTMFQMLIFYSLSHS